MRNNHEKETFLSIKFYHQVGFLQYSKKILQSNLNVCKHPSTHQRLYITYPNFQRINKNRRVPQSQNSQRGGINAHVNIRYLKPLLQVWSPSNLQQTDNVYTIRGLNFNVFLGGISLGGGVLFSSILEISMQATQMLKSYHLSCVLI